MRRRLHKRIWRGLWSCVEAGQERKEDEQEIFDDTS